MSFEGMVNSAHANFDGLQNGLTSMVSGNLSLGDLSALSVQVGMLKAKGELDKGAAMALTNQYRQIGKDLMA